MNKFAERFLELRKKKNLTQRQLAKELNISASAISMYEQGNRLPRINEIIRIADYFNVTLNYLFGRSD